MRKIYLLFVMLVFVGSALQAKHIIGGVLTYECLDNGLYEFTLKMYRDCSDPTGAGFDFNAPLSFYKGNSTVPLTTIYISPSTITSLDPEINDPCLILPPNICVQEGIYTFTYQFSDWPSTEPYTISYQRCCRNATVSNMLVPGDTGATFSVEISPESQALCNNSPVFETFPPIVICSDQPIDYFHTAVDEEGDQLIYELCAPLKGGGDVGGAGNPGDPTGCDGIVPNPACPPPYDPVDYIPPYNPLNPLGGNPQMEIDPVTGFLSGIPEVQGQFVVGVCVSEYRNGQLLSVIRRDFQFNVASCEPVVLADIVEDSTLSDQSSLVRFCQGDDYSIKNESILNASVDDFIWLFEFGDSTYTYEELEPTLEIPESGLYEGTFMINPGSICGDTVNIIVQLFPEVSSDFSFAYDTCIAGPVYFTDQSFTGSGQISEWLWNFGDGGISGETSPFHIYGGPGDFTALLKVTDINGCSDSRIQTVPYFPVPGLILVSPNDTVSCPPASVIFTNLSSPVDENYEINWDFGDGNVSNDFSPVHTFEEPGNYSISLEIVSPIGCQTDTVFENLIQIEEAPRAGFSYQPLQVTSLDPEVTFTDESMNAAYRSWRIDGRLYSTRPDWSVIMPDTGLQLVELVVAHPEGCQDTAQAFIDVLPLTTWFMPNAFTPNNDGLNDLFHGKGTLLGITDFQLEVWDRWGSLVYQTNDPDTGWNGRKQNTGRLAPDGVYVWYVSFTGPRGVPNEYKGYVSLMR